MAKIQGGSPMKKSLVFCMVFAMFILATAISTQILAADGEEISPEKLEKKFSLEGALKLDLYVPMQKGKQAFIEPGLFLYGHYRLNKDWGLGAGVDQWGGYDRLQSNHWNVKPFATVNWRQFYGIAGYSVDTRKFGDNHIFFGMWYVNKFGKFEVFLDPRFYKSVNSNVSDYVDLFGSVKYALNDKYKVGVEGEWTHWLGRHNDHHWSFVRILGERKFNGFSFGLGPGIAWDISKKNGTETTFYLRTYILF